MTDAEVKKWEQDLKVLQRAVEASPNGSAQQAIYAAMAMTLGAVLKDLVYAHNFRESIERVKSLLSRADPRRN